MFWTNPMDQRYFPCFCSFFVYSHLGLNHVRVPVGRGFGLAKTLSSESYVQPRKIKYRSLFLKHLLDEMCGDHLFRLAIQGWKMSRVLRKTKCQVYLCLVPNLRPWAALYHNRFLYFCTRQERGGQTKFGGKYTSLVNYLSNDSTFW